MEPVYKQKESTWLLTSNSCTRLLDLACGLKQISTSKEKFQHGIITGGNQKTIFGYLEKRLAFVGGKVAGGQS